MENTEEQRSESSQPRRSMAAKLETMAKNDTLKKLAYEKKLLGNLAYGRKDFDTAMTQYQSAIEYDPDDMVFHTNIAAVHFEKQDYDACIRECERAIEIGQENSADPQLIAKAHGRIGKAYRKMGRYQDAKECIETALKFHCSKELLLILNDIEKKLKELRVRAYIDPIKAESENELGTEKYEAEEFAEGVKHFGAAIKANPNNPKYYINRAACYAKLECYELALIDCDASIKIDGSLIQGYLIKGQIYNKMNRPIEARAEFKKVLELDPQNEIAETGVRENQGFNPDTPVEKKDIDLMSDPEMLEVFHDIFNNPDSLDKHLNNPKVVEGVQKMLNDS